MIKTQQILLDVGKELSKFSLAERFDLKPKELKALGSIARGFICGGTDGALYSEAWECIPCPNGVRGVDKYVLLRRRAIRHTGTPLGASRLERLESDLQRIRRNKADGPMLVRFGYDHGSATIQDSSGKLDLLFESKGEYVRSDAARLLTHCSPETITELLRGYRLAKDAGLLL